MSIKHALLALLAQEPTHGYELKRRFDQTIGDLWPLQQPQIYNNLKLLEKAGQIERGGRLLQKEQPRRKEFRLTEAGLHELNSWLQSPTCSNRKLKDDFYLKLMTLVHVLEQPEKIDDLLWKQRDLHLQTLRELEQALSAAEETGDPLMAALLEGAILHTEADLRWLDRVEERLATGGKIAGDKIADGKTIRRGGA